MALQSLWKCGSIDGRSSKKAIFYSKRQKYLPFAIKQMHTTARGILLLRNMRSAQTETTKVVSYRNIRQEEDNYEGYS